MHTCVCVCVGTHTRATLSVYYRGSTYADNMVYQNVSLSAAVHGHQDNTTTATATVDTSNPYANLTDWLADTTVHTYVCSACNWLADTTVHTYVCSSACNWLADTTVHTYVCS